MNYLGNIIRDRDERCGSCSTWDAFLRLLSLWMKHEWCCKLQTMSWDVTNRRQTGEPPSGYGVIFAPNDCSKQRGSKIVTGKVLSYILWVLERIFHRDIIEKSVWTMGNWGKFELFHLQDMTFSVHAATSSKGKSRKHNALYEARYVWNMERMVLACRQTILGSLSSFLCRFVQPCSWL